MNREIRSQIFSLVAGLFLGGSLLYGKVYFVIPSMKFIVFLEKKGWLAFGGSGYLVLSTAELALVGFITFLVIAPLGWIRSKDPIRLVLLASTVSAGVQVAIRAYSQVPFNILFLTGIAVSVGVALFAMTWSVRHRPFSI